MLVKELKVSDVLPPAPGNEVDEIALLTGQLQGVEQRIGKLVNDLKGDGEFDMGLKLLRKTSKPRRRNSPPGWRRREKAATDEAEVLSDTQSLIELLAKTEGEERLELRTKIKARILQLVSEMRMLVVPRGQHLRYATLQVWFRGSNRQRVLLIVHIPGHRYDTTRRWQAVSLAEVMDTSNLDLRKPTAHAARLEKALATVKIN